MDCGRDILAGEGVFYLPVMRVVWLLDLLSTASSTSNDVSVMITSNITDGIICYNKSIQLSCHANDANITTYKWTSPTFKQAQQTASITVIATADPVQYTCIVTDTRGNSGYSSVNISSNGEFYLPTCGYCGTCTHNRYSNIYDIF